jgi:hypothetical protein
MSIMQNHLVLRTSIPDRWIKKHLLKGIAMSLIGLIPLIYIGGFASLPVLQKWGFFVFLLGFGFITLGLLPYKKLISIQQRPHELRFFENNHITYYRKGRKIFDFPISMIKDVRYYQNKNDYGILVYFKNTFDHPMRIYEPHFNITSFQKASSQFEKCDLFFRFFSTRSFNELKEWLEEEIINPFE